MNNGNDLVQISLDDISSNAIKESIKKFTRLLIEGVKGYEEKYKIDYWSSCRICIEVDEINGINYYCYNCPLYTSKWCREYDNESRLNHVYHEHQEETSSNWKKNWEKDVNDYIWWLTIEIETRDNYDNNAELQSMGIVE